VRLNPYDDELLSTLTIRNIYSSQHFPHLKIQRFCLILQIAILNCIHKSVGGNLFLCFTVGEMFQSHHKVWRQKELIVLILDYKRIIILWNSCYKSIIESWTFATTLNLSQDFCTCLCMVRCDSYFEVIREFLFH